MLTVRDVREESKTRTRFHRNFDTGFLVSNNVSMLLACTTSMMMTLPFNRHAPLPMVPASARVQRPPCAPRRPKDEVEHMYCNVGQPPIFFSNARRFKQLPLQSWGEATRFKQLPLQSWGGQRQPIQAAAVAAVLWDEMC